MLEMRVLIYKKRSGTGHVRVQMCPLNCFDNFDTSLSQIATPCNFLHVKPYCDQVDEALLTTKTQMTEEFELQRT